MGLIYNRALFEKAGLDPDKPPGDLGRGPHRRLADRRPGRRQRSATPTTARRTRAAGTSPPSCNSQGGDVVGADGEKATIDTPEGRAVLRNLHDMRWTDDSMGSKQLLVINDVQQMMGSGKLGMYLAAPDNIPILVKEKGGNYQDLALAPCRAARAPSSAATAT